jgi:tRNA(Ile)-lysidine synthase
MADQVELAFRRALRRLIEPGSRVLAAVSGGGDSMALLHMLVRSGAGRPLSITVAHLDHGLRRGGQADRRFVERVAGDYDLPCIADRRSVPDLRRKSESPEEAARRVRRVFLLEAAREADCRYVATGHTLDDQAETVILRLVRGAGPAALAGMAESGPGPFVRPLLRIERDALRAYLDRHDVPFREDPSNRKLRFDRNRVRHLVLPVLAEHGNPRAAAHLVRAAELLRDDAALVDDLARRRYRRLVRVSATGALRLEARRLVASPPPVARRIAHVLLGEAGVDPRRISTRHVDAVVDLAAAGSGKSLDLPGGVRAVRRGRELIVLPGRAPDGAGR